MQNWKCRVWYCFCVFSKYIDLQEALKICEERDYVQEQVFLLGKSSVIALYLKKRLNQICNVCSVA